MLKTSGKKKIGLDRTTVRALSMNALEGVVGGSCSSIVTVHVGSCVPPIVRG